MKTTMKNCSVLLNRNFLDSIVTLKITFPVDWKNSKYSQGSKNSDAVISSSEVSHENNPKFRPRKKVKYSEESRNSSGEKLHSEISDDYSSSDDKETKKHELSKTETSSSEVSVRYSEESRNSSGEKSHSEISDDDSISDDEETIKKHELETEKPMKFNCAHCKKSFGTYSSYFTHKRSHQQYKCIICRTTYKYRQSYVCHMKTFHPERKLYLCEYPGCEKSFKYQILQNSHMKSHFRYTCRFCKKMFEAKHRMRKHVLKFHL